MNDETPATEQKSQPEGQLYLTEILNEIEARANAATPGPWKAMHGDSYCAYPSVLRGCGGPHFILYDASESDVRNADDDFKHPGKDEDVDFIAAARSDVPALVKALRHFRGYIEILRKGSYLHRNSAREIQEEVAKLLSEQTRNGCGFCPERQLSYGDSR